MNRYEYELMLFPSIYKTFKCAGCKGEFKAGDRVWRFKQFAPKYLMICDSCKTTIPTIIDFDPKGSKEPPQLTWNWPWIRQLILVRDQYNCRACGETALQVHHIIPRKKGGTANFQNLVTLCDKCHAETFIRGYGGFSSKATQVKLWESCVEGEVYPSLVKEKVR